MLSLDLLSCRPLPERYEARQEGMAVSAACDVFGSAEREGVDSTPSNVVSLPTTTLGRVRRLLVDDIDGRLPWTGRRSAAVIGDAMDGSCACRGRRSPRVRAECQFWLAVSPLCHLWGEPSSVWRAGPLFVLQARLWLVSLRHNGQISDRV